jgi:phage-related protein
METTKNEMSEYEKHFFNKLSNYLDTKIYFYGSIQRADYFSKSSDIDVDIFTDNEKSTIIKLQNILNLPRSSFNKFVYKLHKTNQLVHGYKVEYIDSVNNFTTEISIYNEKDKYGVLYEHLSKTFLPFYVTFLLLILKTLYYNIQILPKKIYKYLKRIIMNYMVEGEDSEFVTMI